MVRRTLRSLIVFAALVVAYQAYVLLAVPRIEPPLAVKQSRQATQEDRTRAAQAVTKYQVLLSNYFPPDHWSQTQPPKVLANATEQAMLVVDDWQRRSAQADGTTVVEVEVKRFALLVFPTPPRDSPTPPRDAIILEAPQGAKLQFDDFRPERGQIGPITSGYFPGAITIRSDMREPGPDDDLLVETSDLQMNSRLLYSEAPVRFRMGANFGGGQALEIRFLADEHAQPGDSGLKIVGIDSLEIRRDVRMRLQLETDSLLPGADKQPAPDASLQGKRGDEPKPPVDVTCSGPFTFDFVRYVASLDRDVELRQLNPNGPSDQLSCKQLDIHFVPRPLPGSEAEPVVLGPGGRQRHELGRLEPAAIVAEGHPVVVASPARGAEARGERIQIAIREQRVRIGGHRDALLVYGPNVLRAPAIDYQHPPRETAATFGRFQASGPGSLDYVPDPAKPQQVFRATWQTSVELDRERGQPVLTLEGRPQVTFADAGSLLADRLKVYLRELEGQAATGLGVPVAEDAEGRSKLQVVPDRVVATGRVEIRSPQLTGRTDELLATFRIRSEPGVRPQVPGVRGAYLTPDTRHPTPNTFHIDTDKMQMDVYLEGQSAVPAAVVCDGNVVLREMTLAGDEPQPLEIRGGQLTVDRLDSPAPYITLKGVASSEPGGPLPRPGSSRAELTGRGITLLADTVEAELEGNDLRAWSTGPGKATLLVTRNLDGRPSATPLPLDITWQGGLEFDGRTMIVQRNVLVSSADDTLRCDRLSARLTTPIQLGARIDQQSINLSEIECDGQVAISHLTRDADGVVSHERVQLARLTINQQTGAIHGDGPGVIRSTQFGQGLAALGAVQNPAAAPAVMPPAAAAGNKLYFLRVDFHSGLVGNLYLREMTFVDRVRTVYGPVDAWEQELDATRPETLPPEAITLSCDELRLNEDPVAARAAPNPAGGDNRPIGPVQLQARGNVQIDGQTPGQGAFSAQADRASYEQAKDTFRLEGDGRTPATLWRAGQAGAPYQARKIHYVRDTGEVKVEGIQYFEFTPGDVDSARRPPPR